MEDFIGIALLLVIVGVGFLFMWVINQPTKKAPAKTVSSLNAICDELDAMCGAPSNRKVIATRITIE